MDLNKGSKSKKGNNLIIKTWQRCKSIGRSNSKWSHQQPPRALTAKSKSWPRIAFSMEDEEEDCRRGKAAMKRRVAPEGCFSVYVGPQKQRFVIKTEYVNHPLFKLLLEEAEAEYGYHSEGPLVLPCKVDVFYKVLTAMEAEKEPDSSTRQGCGFPKKGHGSYRLLSPSRKIAINQF
ncbi:hypothetical protein ACOSP7_018767 [Xanthoceras sorbifolium]|uniref:Uncharacterized protein n=1 Tax=Xanthoceras sorbifolium TaxID=99658 RepID=A0ABQ8I287_9ROSI|nr:hypothetical protein JRO89_XS05G0129200 [Xanthoceras sorbifolium]